MVVDENRTACLPPRPFNYLSLPSCPHLRPRLLPSLQVCYLLRQALDMRARWLFRQQFSPEQLAHLPEAVTFSQVYGDPYDWQPQVRLAAEQVHARVCGVGMLSSSMFGCLRSVAAAVRVIFLRWVGGRQGVWLGLGPGCPLGWGVTARAGGASGGGTARVQGLNDSASCWPALAACCQLLAASCALIQLRSLRCCHHAPRH